MKKAIAAVVVVLVLGALGYLAAGPYTTLKNIRQGVAENNQELLAANVDFPLLRDNLKAQLKGSIAKAVAPGESAPDENENVSEFKKNMSALSAEFAEKFANKMVDALITPAGMAKLAGRKLDMTPNGTPGTPAVQEPEKNQFLADARVEFESLNTVHAVVPGQEGSADTKFVLTRQGVTWRLTNVLMPLETAPQ